MVASRDDLLRAVREYMAQRTAASAPRRKPRTHADESADEFNAAAPEAIAPPPTPLPEISEISEVSEAPAAPPPPLEPQEEPPPPVAGGHDIFDILASRRAMNPRPGDAAAPPPPAPTEPAAPPPSREPLKVNRPSPPTPRPSESKASESAPPSGPSAMARERVLSKGAGPKPPTRTPAGASESSLSSFSLTTEGRAFDPYPEGFVSQGLRLLVTRQWGPALDFYRAEARKSPRDPRLHFGQGAALFGLNRLEEAADWLQQGLEAAPDFPLARLVVESRPDDPIAWYNLAAALVAERTVSAYNCAEIILTECLGGAEDDALRGRAQRVQQDIARMLEQRARIDEERRGSDRGTLKATLTSPPVVAGLAIAAVACWFAVRTLLNAPAPPTPSSSTSPSPTAVSASRAPAPASAAAKRR